MIRYTRLAWLLLASAAILALTYLASTPDPLATPDRAVVEVDR